jgi:hypothetical protein
MKIRVELSAGDTFISVTIPTYKLISNENISSVYLYYVILVYFSKFYIFHYFVNKILNYSLYKGFL